MSIHEPATLVTDCLLAALAGGLAWRLPRHRPVGNRAAGWWCIALALTAVSALVGGLYHGFAPNFPALAGGWWTLTLLLLGLLGATMALSLVHELAPARTMRRWKILIAAKFTLVATIVFIAPAFLVAMIDYGLVMLAWAAAALVTRRPWRGWMLAAIALSAVAAAVQQLRWGLSAGFNHNDVYHLMQALAIGAFYRAGLRLGTSA